MCEYVCVCVHVCMCCVCCQENVFVNEEMKRKGNKGKKDILQLNKGKERQNNEEMEGEARLYVLSIYILTGIRNI